MKTLNRRNFLQITGSGIAASVVHSQSAANQNHVTSESQKPNVILIISDDHAFTDYGFMRHSTVQTPHIDRLASEGVVFTRGYVTTALCCPSLSTLLTGLYPHQHKITGNDPVNKDERHLWFHAFEQCPRLPALLSEAGYVSFQTGKFWMEHYSRAGFTDGMTVEGRHGGAGLEIGRSTMQPIYDFIDQAQRDNKPFFVWYAPFLPHTPHNPPEHLLEKYQSAGENAKYYAMCEWLDQTCGELLAYLDRQNLDENTIVIYLADNGWTQPYKGSPYELGVRTPVIIRRSGHLAPRMDTSHLASNIDIVPTILTACGLTPSPGMPGMNLLDTQQIAARDTIFLENYAHDMIRVDQPARSLRARSCIQDDWKLILWQKEQPKVRTSGQPKPDEDIELYQLSVDPLETSNLADTHPEKVAQLTKRINDWWNPD
ncbi:MAG: sulfatase [bacterium]|jgi:arylsulfatase A-like enzyme